MSDSTNIRNKMYQLAQQRDLFEQAKSYAYDYMDEVFSRNVFPSEAALAKLSSFDEPLPQAPAHPADMLRMLHEYGSPATVTTTGGRYFGLVVGGVDPGQRRQYRDLVPAVPPAPRTAGRRRRPALDHVDDEPGLDRGEQRVDEDEAHQRESDRLNADGVREGIRRFE